MPFCCTMITNQVQPMLANYPSAVWDRRDDKIFEKCLMQIPDCAEDRWQRIANCLHGKSPEDVRNHYELLLHDVMLIDMGRVALPVYPDEVLPTPPIPEANQLPPQSLSWGSVESNGKKFKPWSRDEHRQFLIGLEKYGKGDWRNISRNAVPSRSPTQVASHAQKYFLRQSSMKKERKRSSIHDITTIEDDTLPVPAQPNLPCQAGSLPGFGYPF